MEEQEFDIQQEYETLRTQYDLPDLCEFTKDFDIEKLDIKTSYLAREIRRAINEKLSAYIHLFETLLNPQGPPMFVFKILKNMTQEEKQNLQELYKILSKYQIDIMKLDTIYSEENEIQYIKDVFEMWQKQKQKIFQLFESFETNFENSEAEKSKTYFD
jgi:hypothetical protein